MDPTRFHHRLAGVGSAAILLARATLAPVVAMFRFALPIAGRARYAAFGLFALATTALAPSPALAVQPVADVTIAQVETATQIRVGNYLTYRVKVTNNGPDTAAAVRLTDQIPATTVFVSASPGCVFNGVSGVLFCPLGDLATGASTWRSITVRPFKVGLLTNVARATSPITFDPLLANNVGSVTTTVTP
jgi:uncharacterized repeat protein (TIGR01451 family)